MLSCEAACLVCRQFNMITVASRDVDSMHNLLKLSLMINTDPWGTTSSTSRRCRALYFNTLTAGAAYIRVLIFY